MKIFLSHSSRDKQAVRQLADELKRQRISVWLDEWEIEVGDSITSEVEKGLNGANFVAVWITKYSIESGWVTKEWQSKIFDEISSKKISVLPLLAEDCDIPLFLRDKKYADFRGPFSVGLESLVRALDKHGISEKTNVKKLDNYSVTECTKRFLADLEDSQIPFPTVGNLKLVRTLKLLPRSGKLLRLDGMTPRIPIRSIYDHILSVAHSADCLIPIYDSELQGRDRIELARVIAYHDICEAIIGDIPQYSKLNRASRSKARVSAEILLSQLPEGEPERITNKFISMYLQDSERHSLQIATEILDGDSQVKRTMYVLDKLDPIIAIWRYIHQFRNNKAFSIDTFLVRTRHFFENPTVRVAVAENSNDPRLVELVDKLQDPVNARSYYSKLDYFEQELFAFPKRAVRSLIEDIQMTYAPFPKTRIRRKTTSRAKKVAAKPRQ